MATTTTKPDWSLSYERLMSFGSGIATSFLAPLIGLGGDVAGKAFRNNKCVLKCQKLETIYFSPTHTYIAQSMATTTVKAYLKKHYWKSIYMITGLKIAHGGSITSDKSIGNSADVAVSIDTTTLTSVPVQGMPHISAEMSQEHAVSFGLCHEPFVIGYQLLKITPKFNGEFKDEPFSKFALLSDDQNRIAEEEELELLREKFDLTAVREQSHLDGETSGVLCIPELFDNS
ncbi:hypothetical protein FPRO05_10813 [Fusarium proliferatum]|uniref:Uncharacterized protein n=1 Tax=Gibberella intermedia TaxID=948311 RepID=A0A365NCI5_GIBIN|nr:hypothetical protein FPRO05_10813 [Fusarium proliferatum]